MRRSRAKDIRVPEYAYRFDIATYHRLCESGLLPRNLELIHGILVEKMTLSPQHSYIVGKLRELLEGAIGDGEFIREEKPLTIQNSEPEPDLAVVSGTLADFRKKHPETARFVIEVSQTSLVRDRAKAAIYAAAGVPEFWIVDIENNKIEAFRKPTAEGYDEQITFNAGEGIPLPIAPDTKTRLQDLL